MREPVMLLLLLLAVFRSPISPFSPALGIPVPCSAYLSLCSYWLRCVLFQLMRGFLEMDEGSECSICLQSFFNGRCAHVVARPTSCSHFFCAKCLDRAKHVRVAINFPCLGTQISETICFREFRSAPPAISRLRHLKASSHTCRSIGSFNISGKILKVFCAFWDPKKTMKLNP